MQIKQGLSPPLNNSKQCLSYVWILYKSIYLQIHIHTYVCTCVHAIQTYAPQSMLCHRPCLVRVDWSSGALLTFPAFLKYASPQGPSASVTLFQYCCCHLSETLIFFHTLLAKNFWSFVSLFFKNLRLKHFTLTFFFLCCESFIFANYTHYQDLNVPVEKFDS